MLVLGKVALMSSNRPLNMSVRFCLYLGTLDTAGCPPTYATRELLPILPAQDSPPCHIRPLSLLLAKLDPGNVLFKADLNPLTVLSYMELLRGGTELTFQPGEEVKQVALSVLCTQRRRLPGRIMDLELSLSTITAANEG